MQNENDSIYDEFEGQDAEEIIQKAIDDWDQFEKEQAEEQKRMMKDIGEEEE